MRLLSILLLVGALFAGFPAPGGAETDATTVETAAQKLERWEFETLLIEQQLSEEAPGAAEINEMLEVVDAQRGAILELAERTLDGLKPLLRQLEALGDPPEDLATESQAIVNERKWLTGRIAERDAMAKRVGAAEARVAALYTRLNELRHQLFTDRMLHRGPSLLDPAMLGKALTALGHPVEAIKLETLYRLERQNMSASRVLGVLMPLTIALVVGFPTRRIRAARRLRSASP